MIDDLRSILGSTAVLGVAARSRLVRLALLTVLLQSAHFVEELARGLHQRLPELLGLPPMSLALFVTFNLFWIAVWLLAVVGIRMRIRAALFPTWFLAIATTLNGVIHPLLALAERAYFPGLWTSPVVGAVGAILLFRLAQYTRPR